MRSKYGFTVQMRCELAQCRGHLNCLHAEWLVPAILVVCACRLASAVICPEACYAHACSCCFAQFVLEAKPLFRCHAESCDHLLLDLLPLPGESYASACAHIFVYCTCCTWGEAIASCTRTSTFNQSLSVLVAKCNINTCASVPELYCAMFKLCVCRSTSHPSSYSTQTP